MFSLVVMAAGIGRRFGGDKQLVEVGPDGEAFLDYAISAAATAGASKVVLVVRSEIEPALRDHVDARHRGLRRAGIEFAYVRQDEHIPPGVKPRVKPWGTAHAVLTAAPEIPGPFLVCNADDYYGPSAMAALASAAADLNDGEACLCGYRLGATLSATGTVSRGVCRVCGDRLDSIVEHHGVTRQADGTITATEPTAELSEETIVSMNLWAFPRAAFDWIGDSFERFLADYGGDTDVECLLPAVVAERMAEAGLHVKVVSTAEPWIGVTNPDDLEAARAALAGRPAADLGDAG
ncbi:MAG: NTP transferase domain-containing protein [Acidimicrobiia bacterium]|nr:NTP transferase domain-containing protein [Acidimicrobiia bacterium]